ncbi:CAAX amino terminal protease self- immunity [Symmachiella macrocystis]|uniref:CAAX amino terminal protease self-immunity n=1 Tax=Symmachiella macrocystis TaxID=2527985 RepID=A0A5C6B605_9PLAN|nr:CPBP family intramembrane glutamic endopeptidase [Symmachiella macrocystis]TWU07022.1 CAAX amino terminal protease self- immunity [Symmachiella macrocystis]
MFRSKPINDAPPPEEPGALTDDDYWTSSRRPLSCLIFLLPLLGLYEVGVLWLGGSEPASYRNGADHWMRTALHEVGLVQVHVLPAIVIGLLLAWHLGGRYAWKVNRETLLGMTAESLLFALMLVVIGQLQSLAFAEINESTLPASTALASAGLSKVVSFVGAGVYEEVLFRLWMLPLCYAVFYVLFRSARWAAGTAILVTSVLFSLAHYVGPHGDAFSALTFSFRAMAGSFFALLFLLRGFGITVGCHAAYDLLVGILLVDHT